MSRHGKSAARRETVALTRADIENILVHAMGWEHEDVTTFWRLARAEMRAPGTIRRKNRDAISKALIAAGLS